jgi:perosamine synthetase
MIPVNEPLLNGNEKKYLQECIDTGWIGSEGPFVKEFENKFAALNQRKYGIAVCNGSAALEMAVLALDIKNGDEVIIPAFTIISCAAAIVKAGAVPVLVDCHLDTWNMKAGDVAKKITPKTKAIMLVHVYGLPVDLQSILNLAREKNIKIIEDAAEAHGQTYKGQPCGSFGDISVFSFYPNKLITTGEGGMLLTNDPLIDEKCRSLRNLCFIAEKRFVHEDLGSNFRMTNMQAALGLAQLERWKEFIAKKRAIGAFYSEQLKNIDTIHLPVPKTPYADNIYWVFGILLKKEKDKTAELITKELNQKGIGTRPFFYPMHLQPVFHKMDLFTREDYPNSADLYNYGFYIPSGLAITEAQMNHVVIVLKEVLSY